MPRTSRKKGTRIKSSLSKKRVVDPRVSGGDLNRLEFHRQALALMPAPDDKDPGVAVMVDDKGPAL
ncbi:MAG: hypothetical protein PVG73_01415, partial [Desulfobacterales bacterium]